MRKKYFLMLLLFAILLMPVKSVLAAGNVDENLYTEANAPADFKKMTVWFNAMRTEPETRFWKDTGSVRAMWKATLDGTLPNILTQGKQNLGNNVGDSVTYQFTTNPPKGQGDNGAGFRPPSGADEVWIGYAYSLMSSKFNTDYSALSNDGQIQVSIKTNYSAATGEPKYMVTFTRMAERVAGDYSIPQFDLNGLKSQFDFYKESYYPTGQWLTPTATLKYKYHILIQADAALNYNFSGWFKQDTLAEVKTKDVNTMLASKGGSWTPLDGLESVTDEKGQKIDPAVALEQNLVQVAGEVDLNTPGTYEISYSYNYTNELGVDEAIVQKSNVLVDGSWIESTQPSENVTLYFGENFDLGSLVKITNENGQEVPFDKEAFVKTTDLVIENGKIASQPGTYSIIYHYYLPWKKEFLEIPFNINVKSNAISLNIPTSVNLGSFTLGTENTKLFWPSENIIEVTDERKNRTKWNLYAQVIAVEVDDFKNLIKFNDQTLQENTLIYAGLGDVEQVNINENWSESTGVKVDYSGVETTRSDSATIQWSLIPDTGEIVK